MAVATVAGLLLMHVVHLASTVNPGPTHMRYSASTHPDMMSSISVALQATTRNTKLLTSIFLRPASGPGTKTIFYETAALALAAATAGSAFMEGVQSATGNHEGHCSGLEARFVGEVCHASEGLSRQQANDIARQLIARYAGIFDDPPIGRPFPEVYDLRTLKPTAEWEGMYEEAKQELTGMGLRLA
jgi:methylamine--corrinoid protein Co-methyltransferase